MLKSLRMILACSYKGFMFPCCKATVCSVCSNQENWWRGCLWECARLLKNAEAPVLGGQPPTMQWPASDWYINTHRRTHTHTQPQGAQERAVCLHHSTGCRQGWTPSSGHGGGAVLHNTQTNVASYPLHRSYSDTVPGVVIQPTLIATAAPNLKTSSSHLAPTQNVCLQGLKGVYLYVNASMWQFPPASQTTTSSISPYPIWFTHYKYFKYIKALN